MKALNVCVWVAMFNTLIDHVPQVPKGQKNGVGQQALAVID